MVPNIFVCRPATPHPLTDPEDGHNWSKFNFFRNSISMVMLHIILKGIMNTATWYQMFCLQPPHPLTDPEDGHNWSKFNFFRNSISMVMLHIILKGIMNTATWYQMFCLQPPPPPPPPDSRDGVNRSNFNCFGTWSCCISNYRDHECTYMVANILPADPHATLGMRSKGRNSTILEYGHMAYKINGISRYSNMVPIFFSQTPHLTLGSKVKLQLFQNMLMLHILLNEITK